MNTEHTYDTKNGKEIKYMAYSKLLKSKVKGLYCPYYIGYIIVDENYVMKYHLYSKFFSVVPNYVQRWKSQKPSSYVIFHDDDNGKKYFAEKAHSYSGLSVFIREMLMYECDIFYVTFGVPFDSSYTPRLEGTVFVPLRELRPDPPEVFSRSTMPKVLNPLPTMVPGTSDWGWKLMPYRRHYY